ncbi:MAG: pantoate--beta-alanine ligase [Verrucomicrobiaceae bacterium]|jgi:pantoate--beta-alanine ligase|nr:pantoate--beta-alanine ligase [Verrucomicrobiales bacterium]MBN77310.1 pantoate--beta-alanine ligase [Verrucomicrobiaceae bacterium]
MKIIRTIKELSILEKSKPVILVPTMGALHDGHRKLIKEGKSLSSNRGTLVVSIYVNPIQFNSEEDLDKYPRTFNEDSKVCDEEGVDIIFLPTDSEMYPDQPLTKVTENTLSKELCGLKRPGHFDGVCTVVTKLFNIIKPNTAVFGKKDYQQLSIIKQLVTDLNYAIEILPVETHREPNGLAMSSRNQHLNLEEKEKAATIYKALCAMAESKKTVSQEIIELGRSIIEKESQTIKIEYLEIVDRTRLDKLDIVDKPALAAIAVIVGKTRLIDNIEIDR